MTREEADRIPDDAWLQSAAAVAFCLAYGVPTSSARLAQFRRLAPLDMRDTKPRATYRAGSLRADYIPNASKTRNKAWKAMARNVAWRASHPALEELRLRASNRASVKPARERTEYRLAESDPRQVWPASPGKMRPEHREQLQQIALDARLPVTVLLDHLLTVALAPPEAAEPERARPDLTASLSDATAQQLHTASAATGWRPATIIRLAVERWLLNWTTDPDAMRRNHRSTPPDVAVMAAARPAAAAPRTDDLLTASAMDERAGIVGAVRNLTGAASATFPPEQAKRLVAETLRPITPAEVAARRRENEERAEKEKNASTAAPGKAEAGKQG